MPKVIDHDQRRREIVDVAKKLICEHGFDAVTMRSIVSEAGFANGALKHYFPSKDSIIAATFESVLGETEQRLAAVDPALSPQDALRVVVEAALPLDKQRIASARMLLALWERSMSDAELGAQYRRLLNSWQTDLAQRVSAARGQGEKGSAPAVRVLVDEVMAVTIGAHVASLMYPPGKLIARYRTYAAELAERVAATAKPAPAPRRAVSLRS
jgi:AcrR family transcriptional regulator